MIWGRGGRSQTPLVSAPARGARCFFHVNLRIVLIRTNRTIVLALIFRSSRDRGAAMSSGETRKHPVAGNDRRRRGLETAHVQDDRRDRYAAAHGRSVCRDGREYVGHDIVIPRRRKHVNKCGLGGHH